MTEKMKKIEIKAWFSDWHEVTEEKAREFALSMMKGITTRSTFEGKAKLIDGTHLRGITCKELLKESAKMKNREMRTRYYENGDKTTIVRFKFVGYGVNAQPVYQKIITVYSISDGVLIDNEPQPVKVFYR